MTSPIVGIRADITTYEQYDRIDAVRFSALVNMAKSSLHFVTAEDCDDDSTSSQEKNQAIHCLILEPEEFKRQFSVYSGKSRYGKSFDAHMEAWPGTTALLASWLLDIHSTAEAVRFDPRTGGAFTGPGWSEVTFTWTDPETDVECKARLDRLFWSGENEITIVDCKAIGTSARDISRRVSERNWHVQAAHQIAGVRAHNPDIDIHYKWCCYESDPPFDVCMARPADSALELGEQTRMEWLREVAKRRESGVWQGRHTEDITVDVAFYKYPSDDEEGLESEPIFGPKDWATTGSAS